MDKFFIFVLIFPLLGFIVNLFFGKRIKSEKFIGIFSSAVVLIPFLITVYFLIYLYSLEPHSRFITLNLLNWIAAGFFNIQFSFLIDPLSLCMVLVVTGVGFLIHWYSIGYMHNDSMFSRFFAYMNLFILSMLILVLADNFLLLFLGWEGVGLCSYLLIGFWYEKKFTGDAAKKAFIVNRIGDFGFMIAMFLIFLNFGTLNISQFLAAIPVSFEFNSGLLVAVSLLLFLGATGKSAQIPLFVWLPDAMAGPTPVSALIHAATMVTAGVYLIARCSLLYVYSPITTNIVLIIGIFTALIAAVIAAKQNDIKKILAYSTISQLGFMFVALGTFTYWLAIFHLITHAFFKALLFLGSGSVIHAMSDEQDIRNMGALKDKMKITYYTFLIGALAISGIPPLAGFWSKDEILFKTFLNSGLIFYIVLLGIAFLTAFYMFRLVTLTFYGEPRYAANIHPHESPKSMTIPLLILCGLSVIGGFIGLPHITHLPNFLERFLSVVFDKTETALMMYSQVNKPEVSLEIILLIVSVVVALISITYSYKKFSAVKKFKASRGFAKIVENKFYVDEIYDKIIVNPLYFISDKLLWKIFDIKIIDGFINGLADFIKKLGEDWRRIQSGIVQDYALITVSGIIIIIIYLIFF